MEESETLNTHDEAAPSSSSQPRKNKKLDKRDADEDELDKALREMANQSVFHHDYKRELGLSC